MHLVALIAAVVCLVAWLYFAFVHGRFWSVDQLGAPAANTTPSAAVAVVIPARNEADVIGRAVTSLLQQHYAGPLHIFVVDDHSTDGTADAACQSAADLPDALTVISGQPLPSGWSGKLWAMQQGVEQALQLQPQFLLLTDADIQHSPGNIATLVALAEVNSYDLVSFMVKLQCRSVAEKLLIPAFVFFFFLLYPPRWVRDPRRRLAGAAGGCMLIRPHALANAGGLAAIRHEIIDDCALARAVKRSGEKIWLGLTSDTLSLRAYNSFGEIERMIARTAFNQLRHSAWLLLGALVGMFLLYVLPLALLFTRSLRLAMLGVAAYSLMSTLYWPMVRLYRLPAVWALTLPLSALFYIGATVHSAMKFWSGSGGEWKGRAQDQSG